MKASDVYIRGRLLKDCELVVFGTREERNEAVDYLRSQGFSVRANQAMIGIFDELNKIGKYIKKYIGKPLIYGISRGDTKRSNRQLRFYFGVVIHGIRMFYEESGYYYTKEQVHLDCLVNIWGWKPVEETIGGRSIIRMDLMPSTGRMSVEDFTNFLKMIEVEYAEKGLNWTEYINDDDDEHNQEAENKGMEYEDEGDGTLNQYYQKYKK